MSEHIRYVVVFTGRVQGVFFRATAVKLADAFAVTGWVRNDPDGSVRLEAEGEPAELDRFIAAIQQAKAANITDTQVQTSEATGGFDGFAVRG